MFQSEKYQAGWGGSRLRRSHIGHALKFIALKQLHLRLCPCNIAPSMAENNHHASRLLHLRLSRVCVAVVASDPEELVNKAELLARDNTFLEFRLDYIARPATALDKVSQFTETHPHIAVIATCRRAAAGGKFQGSVAAQLEILAKAAAAGCQLMDVELQTAARLKPAQFEKLRSKAAIVLSFHDFHATTKLDETLKKMAAYPADFYKVVGTARSLY